MIVVTGVTGKLGGIVAKDLLTRVPAADLVAVARTPQKAATLADQGVEVRAGDYEDPESLRAAFAGADVLLFVSSPDITPGTRVRQHGNVIDAARAAGVGRIVYTSAIGAQDGVGFLADHTATETMLRESGVPHTLLRNTFYMEALVNPGLRSAVESGELVAADGGQPVNFATITDLALAASATLYRHGTRGRGVRGARRTLDGARPRPHPRRGVRAARDLPGSAGRRPRPGRVRAQPHRIGPVRRALRRPGETPRTAGHRHA